LTENDKKRIQVFIQVIIFNWFNLITQMDHGHFLQYMLSYKCTGKISLGHPRRNG
jgi:hypothetical protein